MADSGVGSVLKWGLIAGGAYYLYQALYGSGTVAAAAAPSTPAGTVTMPDLAAAAAGVPPAPPAPPVVAPAPAASGAASQLAAELNAAAAGDANLVNGQMSAWQWRYYFNNVLQRTPVSDALFTAAFPDPAALLTADRYAAALLGNGGLSGLGRVTIPVPVVFDSDTGRRVMVWAARDLASSADGPRAAVFSGASPLRLGPARLPALREVRRRP